MSANSPTSCRFALVVFVVASSCGGRVEHTPGNPSFAGPDAATDTGAGQSGFGGGATGGGSGVVRQCGGRGCDGRGGRRHERNGGCRGSWRFERSVGSERCRRCRCGLRLPRGRRTGVPPVHPRTLLRPLRAVRIGRRVHPVPGLLSPLRGRLAVVPCVLRGRRARRGGRRFGIHSLHEATMRQSLHVVLGMRGAPS